MSSIFSFSDFRDSDVWLVSYIIISFSPIMNWLFATDEFLMNDKLKKQHLIHNQLKHIQQYLPFDVASNVINIAHQSKKCAYLISAGVSADRVRLLLWPERVSVSSYNYLLILKNNNCLWIVDFIKTLILFTRNSLEIFRAIQKENTQ